MGEGTTVEIARALARSKNPLSVFVTSGCGLIHYFANQQPSEYYALRWVMIITSILIFAGVAVFYVFLTIRFPSTAQEAAFEGAVRHDVEDHERKVIQIADRRERARQERGPATRAARRGSSQPRPRNAVRQPPAEVEDDG